MTIQSVILLSLVLGGVVLGSIYYMYNASSMSQTNSNKAQVVPSETKTMLVAGGCFWCVEADLEKLPGVVAAVSGYAGGDTTNPTYETYKNNGHREVVEVTYDPNLVSYEAIVIYALKHMDPTDGEGSFYDRGAGYAPAVYYENETEKQIIEQLIKEINDQGPYDKPLAVAIAERPTFYPAEAYHQDYYKGSLSSVKYQYYRRASGRDAFIEKYWGNDTGPDLPWRDDDVTESRSDSVTSSTTAPWLHYQKPPVADLRSALDSLTFKVTQENGTEPAFSSPLDKEYGRGIYVDVLSGEPLFSSRDKFDSGTGWPSFTQPISPTAVTEHEDRKFWMVRTEIRSALADNHLGHVFPDGPAERGGLRYCMNGVALRFIPEADMIATGYEDFLAEL